MKRVIVMATVHRENGAANSKALADILKRIKPELIFLETSKEEMNGFFSEDSLEGLAITLLAKYQAIELVPVDVQVMHKNELLRFHRLSEFLDSCCDEISQSAYREIQMRVSSDGFYFLNSPDYIEMQAGLEALDERLVESRGDYPIRMLHAEWKSAQSYRENWMIERIAMYCQSGRFDSAVLLVGAAHIHSLRSQIKERSHLFNDVEWVYGI